MPEAARDGRDSAGGSGDGRSDPNFYVVLLIGQSNMVGVPAPEPQDREAHPRVKVLAYEDCANLGRSYNEWYPASPPLHGCDHGVGPGDYLGRTLADAYPSKTIGLVPCAIPGVDIAYFQKGVTSTRRGEFRIPPDDHWGGAYEWVLARARLAQRSGVIKGIAFHQGESDSGQAAWVENVKGMVDDLRADLGVASAPFVAGELYQGGCCASHNTLVNQLPRLIANTFVVSASGLDGMDRYHFDLPGQRALGRRYGEAFLQALGR